MSLLLRVVLLLLLMVLLMDGAVMMLMMCTRLLCRCERWRRRRITETFALPRAGLHGKPVLLQLRGR